MPVAWARWLGRIAKAPHPVKRPANVTTIDQTEARLNTHEEVCALRYESICARLKRLESTGLTVAGTIIMLLIGILLALLGLK